MTHLKPGTLVEFRYHDSRLTQSNGRIGKVRRRVSGQSQYHVEIVHVPRTWPEHVRRAQLDTVSAWWERDLVVLR